MKRVIVILGQTATGKSDLAVRIAKKTNGEIISADSRQVYKGLDLGSGKITKKEMNGVPHHLLDVIDPRKIFTVEQYKKLADQKIKEILERGKTPILCGGTGFYIDAVTKGIMLPEVPPNKKLRKQLDKKSLASLLLILKKLDPARLKTIDINNKVRIVRAIEIAKSLGRVPKLKTQKPKYKFIKVGLYLPEEKLKTKISKRLEKRILAGMLKEAQKLRKSGLSWKRLESLGLEYREMALYLQKKISREDMVSNLNTQIYQFAKRQITWFKRDKDIKWIDASDKKKINKIVLDLSK